MSNNADLCMVVLCILLFSLVGTVATAWKATEMADSYNKTTRKKGLLILVFLDIVLFGIIIFLAIAK